MHPEDQKLMICDMSVEEMDVSTTPTAEKDDEEQSMEIDYPVEDSGDVMELEHSMASTLTLIMEPEEVPNSEFEEDVLGDVAYPGAPIRSGGVRSLLEQMNMDKENEARAKGALYFYSYLACLVLLILFVKIIQLSF